MNQTSLFKREYKATKNTKTMGFCILILLKKVLQEK